MIPGIADEVVTDLEQAGHEEAAADLRRWVAALDEPDQEKWKKAAQEIAKRCHPRWLGDLYIEGLTLEEWWGKLNRLSRAVQRK